MISLDAIVVHAIVQVDLRPVHVRAQTLADLEQGGDTAVALQVSKQFPCLVGPTLSRKVSIIYIQVKTHVTQLALVQMSNKELAQLG
ncbi:MAG: hypothetical protein JW850_14995 [Thermoflexales bacterium]|nr:hypothetical protein [Thermoflexales bacterium]